MRSRRVAVIALCALAPFAIAACGDSESDSGSDQALTEICTAKDDLSTQVDDLKALNKDTVSVAAVTASLTAIQGDLTTIAGALPELAQEQKDAIEPAVTTFKNDVQTALGSIVQSKSVSDAKAQISSAAATLKSSFETNIASIDCSN